MDHAYLILEVLKRDFAASLPTNQYLVLSPETIIEKLHRINGLGLDFVKKWKSRIDSEFQTGRPSGPQATRLQKCKIALYSLITARVLASHSDNLTNKDLF